MKIAIFDRMEECTDAEVQRMLPLVSEQRRVQALYYRHTFGRFCCLKSWLMLQALIGNVPHFKYNEYGKPYIPSDIPGYQIHFSISHCKTGIVVVVDARPVGVDIESVRKISDDLVERTMNESEQQLIWDAKKPERAFTRLWTQKEAVAKCIGTGITSFEQLQHLLSPGFDIQTTEANKYIYSIATEK